MFWARTTTTADDDEEDDDDVVVADAVTAAGCRIHIKASRLRSKASKTPIYILFSLLAS